VAAPHLAQADDTEVFFDQGSNRTTNPNILFVLPTGETMGCAVGATTKCSTAVTTGDSRMDAVKNALVEVLDEIQRRKLGVNIGLMRGKTGGNVVSNASRGGIVIQHIAPLDDTSVYGTTHLENMKQWICAPKYLPAGGCRFVFPLSGNGAGAQALAPANDPTFDKAGAAGAHGDPVRGQSVLRESDGGVGADGRHRPELPVPRQGLPAPRDLGAGHPGSERMPQFEQLRIQDANQQYMPVELHRHSLGRCAGQRHG
jgi:hypothetical protein